VWRGVCGAVAATLSVSALLRQDRESKRTDFRANARGKENRVMASVLWAVLVVVLALWLLGLLAGTAGSLILLLLVVAVVVLLVNLLTGRTTV
jgi:fatty acid desaturase